MEIKNFSRHNFNSDQKSWASAHGYEVGATLAPFFTSAQDFIQKVGGTVSSVVCPMGILLEALASGKMDDLTTTIIDWVADQGARKRSHFAVAGVRVFQIQSGNVVLISSETITHTVENDFNSGEEFPYGG